MHNVLKIILGTSDFVSLDNIENEIVSVYENLDFNKFIYFMEMLIKTQDILNCKLCGDNYKDTLTTKEGKSIIFGNALLSESNELLDSTDWKHWKDINGNINIQNISVELIDYLHFIPSIIAVMQDKDSTYSFKDKVLKTAWREVNKNTIINPDNDTIKNEVYKLISIASIVSGICNLYFKTNSNMNYHEDYDACNAILTDELLIKLIGIALGITLRIHFMIFNSTIENVWSLYVVKNTLNLFRKDHGYKEGTYNKMWNGVEDNIVATEIMTNNPKFGSTELYDALKAVYKTIG